jgi:methyl-accepting chemotaxis protein
VKHLREKYVAAQNRVQTLLAKDERDKAATVMTDEVLPMQDDLIELMDELFQFQGTILESDGVEAEAMADETFNILVALIAVGSVATFIIASLIIRSIVRPLGGEPADVAAIARHIAGGDLTTSIALKDGDDQSLLADMKSMQHNLRDTVQRLMDSSAQLAAASEEMSAVTEDTTRGLNQQHAELELAVTAVSEMTAAVDEVARNAVSTSESSRKSDLSAQRGREQVMRTVESIDHLAGDVTGTARQVEQLAEQVRDISKLLDVIRSIAEQTNLLALNAAIEAARAGDAGRGFAVVADEVRALAHRTQQSTQEIEQMIGDIKQHSDQSVSSMRNSTERALAALEVARAAGVALEEITVEISGISERNLVIASASEQQVKVAREVDRNLVAIRDVSIQATAGARQTSEASQSLAQLAIELNAMISRFKL